MGLKGQNVSNPVFIFICIPMKLCALRELKNVWCQAVPSKACRGENTGTKCTWWNNRILDLTYMEWWDNGLLLYTIIRYVSRLYLATKFYIHMEEALSRSFGPFSTQNTLVLVLLILFPSWGGFVYLEWLLFNFLEHLCTGISNGTRTLGFMGRDNYSWLQLATSLLGY